MREPSELKTRGARGKRRTEAPEQPTGGKALARVNFFRIQRGLGVENGPSLAAVTGDAAANEMAAPKRGGKRTVRRKPSYRTAFSAKTKMTPDFGESASAPSWRPLGPNHIPRGQTYGTGGNNRPSVSGRTVGMIVHPTMPQRLLLATAGGGVWSSESGGGDFSWIARTDFQPTLSIGAIASAPSAPHIVYAGTGEGDSRSPLGLGILRSSDFGLTWTQVGAVELSQKAIFELAVDSHDPLKLFAATTNGLFVSRDGATSWTLVQLGAGQAEIFDVSIGAGSPGEILAGTETGVYRSTDGGSAWSKLTLTGQPGRFRRVAVCHAAGDNRTAYVFAADEASGYLWRRGTSGAAFAAQALPADLDVGQAWYDWCIAVSLDNESEIYVGAIELYRGRRATSGAWTWSNISSRSTGDSIHPDQHAVVIDPTNPARVYACNDGGLYRSDNRGGSWTALNAGLEITEFEFLAQHPKRRDFLVGGTQDNGTLVKGEGSLTWDQIAFGDGGDCAVVGSTNADVYHSYYGISLERSDENRVDGARPKRLPSWTDITPTPSHQSLFYPPLDVAGTTVAQAGTSVFVSRDKGASWNGVPLPGLAVREYCSSLLIVSATVILAGTTGGKVFRLKASGNWGSATVHAMASPRSAFVSDIVIGPGGLTSELWVSCSHFGGARVFFSDDEGASWDNRAGTLPNIPVNALVVDPADARRVFAATDNGVYESRDGGSAWRDFSNGLPNAVVGDLIEVPGQRILCAGTRNRGAWEVEF